MHLVLSLLAAVNGFLLGGNLLGLAIFEYALLPSGHTLIFPVLLIAATLGAFTVWYIESAYLAPIVLVESIANIALFTHTVKEGNRRK